MQKIIEIEQHLLFSIDFFRVPKYRVRPIVQCQDHYTTQAVCCVEIGIFEK